MVDCIKHYNRGISKMLWECGEGKIKTGGYGKNIC